MNKACYILFGLKLPLYINFALPALLFYDFIKRLLNNKYFRIFLIFVIPTVIFVKILRNDPFFLSDDFDHIILVSNNSYLGVTKLALIGRGIWIQNRIVVGFWLFKLIFELFGARPEPFLAAMFVLHLANAALFYCIAKRFTKSTLFPVFMSIVFSGFYLTWISNIHEVLGATFILSSTFFFFKWLSKEKSIYYSLAFYILAVLTKEIAFLLPLVFVALGTYYHFNFSRLNLKETIKALIPFFIIFFVYLFTYALSNFSGYSGLQGSGSYKMGFSLSAIARNLIYYLTYNFPVFNYSAAALIILAAFPLYDFLKRKPVTTPFVFSYLVLLSPVLLFLDRRSFYYAYIPTPFLLFGLTIILSDIYSRLIIYFKGKPKVFLRLFNIYFVIFLAVFIFRLNSLLLDNCFLIQFPWKNP